MPKSEHFGRSDLTQTFLLSEQIIAFYLFFKNNKDWLFDNAFIYIDHAVEKSTVITFDHLSLTLIILFNAVCINSLLHVKPTVYSQGVIMVVCPLCEYLSALCILYNFCFFMCMDGWVRCIEAQLREIL